MRTLRFTLAYDGTDYAGWQRQENASTIQAVLEAALREVEGRAVTVHGAGRTDAGVHALGQVASTRLSHGIETSALVRALNGKLPNDVRILNLDVVADGFHARYGACSKWYRYRLTSGSVANPLERRYAWHIVQALDVESMQRAGAALCGQHDFAAFQTSAGADAPASTVRTIYRLEISSGSHPSWLTMPSTPSGDVVTIDVVGDGFLRHMVRTMVGTLVEVGRGRRPVEDVAAALASCRRERSGPTAPAHGLFLVGVEYLALMCHSSE